MADDNGTVHLPQGDVSTDGLTTGALGSGSSKTDAGGLSPNGTELAAASPGSDQGLTTAEDEEKTEKGAR